MKGDNQNKEESFSQVFADVLEEERQISNVIIDTGATKTVIGDKTLNKTTEKWMIEQKGRMHADKIDHADL